MGQGVVAPQMPRLFSGSEGHLALSSGISATLMYLGIFVSTLRYGKLADEGKANRLLGVGLISYSLSLVLLSLFHSEACIYMIRFLEGLALSAIYVAADFLLGRLSQVGERGKWLSFYGVALSFGLLLGPAIALTTAHWVSGDLASFFSINFVAILAIGLSYFAFRIRVPRLSREVFSTESNLHRPALISGGVYGYMEAGLVAVFPFLAIHYFNILPEYCLFTVLIAAAVTSVFWGWLADRLGPQRVVLFLLVLLFCGSLLFSGLFSGLLFGHQWSFPKHAIAYLSCVFFGVLARGMYPVAFAWLLKMLPESQYGFASGSFARAYGLGSLLGPMAAGGLVQILGPGGFFLAMGAGGAMGLAWVGRQGLMPARRKTAIEKLRA